LQTIAHPEFVNVADAAMFVQKLLEGQEEAYKTFLGAFEANDKGRTGYVSGVAFVEILETGALHVTPEEAKLMQKDADIHKNGQIAYHRWLKVLTGRATPEEQDKWFQDQKWSMEKEATAQRLKASAERGPLLPRRAVNKGSPFFADSVEEQL